MKCVVASGSLGSIRSRKRDRRHAPGSVPAWGRSTWSPDLVRMGLECDDARVLAITLLRFLGWLGMLLLAIALVVGLVILFAHGPGGGGIDIDP